MVARKAGVSVSTVSHVINRTRFVRAQTRKAVLDAIDGPSCFLAWLNTGPTAVMLAAEHPECLQSLIFVNTLARFLKGDGYEFGVPEEGFYEEILNTDSELFGGSNLGNGGLVSSRPIPRHNRGFSWLYRCSF